jgi:hypothetical protein
MKTKISVVSFIIVILLTTAFLTLSIIRGARNGAKTVTAGLNTATTLAFSPRGLIRTNRFDGG